jgi:hypothetical protein
MTYNAKSTLENTEENAAANLAITSKKLPESVLRIWSDSDV